MLLFPCEKGVTGGQTNWMETGMDGSLFPVFLYPQMAPGGLSAKTI